MHDLPHLGHEKGVKVAAEARGVRRAWVVIDHEKVMGLLPRAVAEGVEGLRVYLAIHALRNVSQLLCRSGLEQ